MNCLPYTLLQEQGDIYIVNMFFGIISANILFKNKTKTPLLLFALYLEDITARNGPRFYAKTAAKE